MKNWFNGGCMAAIAVCVLSLLFAVLFAFIGAIFVALCWNYVIPYVFGLPTISYWQAFCLIILIRLLTFVNVNVKNNSK